MRYSEFKVGKRVTDSWFPSWGTGVVLKVLKTRVKILFPERGDTVDDPTVYDTPHLQFLRPVPRRRKNQN
jgi:hypothetical protein